MRNTTTSGTDINIMDQARLPTLRRHGDEASAEASVPAAVAASSEPALSTQALLTETEKRMADLRRRSASLGSQSERKRSRKKSNDKPKRPLSAYNIFFQLERQKLLEEDNPPNNGSENGKRTTKTKSKLGFASLARYIAAKWKNIDDDSLAHYQDLADKEQRRYMNELVKWKIQEAHNLYDNDGPSTRPDAWVPQQQQDAYQVDEHAMHHQAQLANNGWHNIASSSFLHEDGRFVSGDSASTAALMSGHSAFASEPVTSIGPLTMGYTTDGFPISQLPYQTAHYAAANSNDNWLHQSNDGINTRWSRHLENEMEASVKELSKMVPNRTSGQSVYVQEFEPFPVSYMASAAAAVAAAGRALVEQAPAPVVLAPSPPPEYKQAPQDVTDQNSTASSSPSVQRLRLHLDEEEQEFLIARLVADAAYARQQIPGNDR